jgi:dihydrofolate synthase/folylpolyglutamate synthase
MNLDDWLHRIENLHPLKWDLGLARVGEVAGKLGVINPAPIVFLVAGTNGKGSTCEYLAAFCEQLGLSAGKATSPHFLRFNERVVIDGEMASDEVLCETFESIERARGEISLSYFEFAALAALVIFKDRAVDVAILEIGLGGRLDAMNIVDPTVSVITQIALDHESWLGDNLEKIAVEKAVVMRSGKVCVVSDASPPDSIYSCAADLDSELLFLGKDYGIADGRAWYTSNQGEIIEVNYSDSGHLPLPSAAAAMQALVSAGLRPDDSGLEFGLERVLQSARLPGRLQWLDADKRILLDVAHNPNAAGYLKTYLQSIPQVRRIHAVVGMYSDKDCDSVFSILRCCIDHWYVTGLEGPRGASAEELEHLLSNQAVCAVNTYDKISLAYESAVEMAGETDLVLVFGSFPVVAEVLKLTSYNALYKQSPHKQSSYEQSSPLDGKEH